MQSAAAALKPTSKARGRPRKNLNEQSQKPGRARSTTEVNWKGKFVSPAASAAAAAAAATQPSQSPAGATASRVAARDAADEPNQTDGALESSSASDDSDARGPQRTRRHDSGSDRHSDRAHVSDTDVGGVTTAEGIVLGPRTRTGAGVSYYATMRVEDSVYGVGDTVSVAAAGSRAWIGVIEEILCNRQRVVQCRLRWFYMSEDAVTADGSGCFDCPPHEIFYSDHCDLQVRVLPDCSFFLLLRSFLFAF